MEYMFLEIRIRDKERTGKRTVTYTVNNQFLNYIPYSESSEFSAICQILYFHKDISYLRRQSLDKSAQVRWNVLRNSKISL